MYYFNGLSVKARLQESGLHEQPQEELMQQILMLVVRIEVDVADELGE